MADFSLRDWVELPPSYLMPPPFSLMVPRAVDAVCSLYRKYPAEVGAIVSDAPLPSGATNYILGKICEPAPEQSPPPDPQKPFSGGQCCNVPYEVTVVAKIGENPASTQTYSKFGPIRGIRKETVEIIPGVTTEAVYLVSGGGLCGNPREELGLGSAPPEAGGASASIVSIVRADGFPDDCGDPFPEFPPGRPTPEELDLNIDVEINGDTYNIPVNIIRPDVSDHPYVRPEINIQVGDQFVFNISAEGFTIGHPNPNPNAPPLSPPPDPLPPDALPPIAPPAFPSGGGGGGSGGGGGGGGGCPDVDITPVLRAVQNVDADLSLVARDVKELLECDRCNRPAPEDSRLVRVPQSPAQSKIFVLPEGSQWVMLEVVSRPENAKVQFSPESDNVYYCGWHSFGGSDCNGERIPVHYEKCIFPVIEGSSRFEYTLYNGFVGQATILVLEN